MIIKDIQNIQTGETRTDDKYPMRIGCEVEFLRPPHPGDRAILGYVLDNEGNEKLGALMTSNIMALKETDEEIILTTENSRYILLKEPDDIGFFV